jgi:hypothetical protein
MSARVVAVTALLIDVLNDLDDQDEMTHSEAALSELLHHDVVELQRIHARALAEMQALAPAVLAAEPLVSTG